LTDRLGSIREIANNTTGAFIHEVSYGGFGNVESETTPANGDRYKFTGREFFVEIGLYDYRARTYDATIGRFQQEDPIFMTDVNPYRYVENGPTNATDPMGLENTEWWEKKGRHIPHWHHLLPQEVFTEEFLKKHELDININSKDWGWQMPGGDHIGKGGVHPQGWNEEWQNWIDKQKRNKTPITKESIQKQLDTMKKDPRFSRAFVPDKYHKPADKDYTDWKNRKENAEAAKSIDDHKQQQLQNKKPTTGDAKPQAPSSGGTQPTQPTTGKFKQTIKKWGKKLKDNKGNVASVIVGSAIAWIFGQGEQAFAGEPTQGQPGAPAPGNRPPDGYADTVGDIAMDTAELYVQSKLTDLILQKLGQLPTNPQTVKPSVGGAASNLIVFSWAVDLVSESPAIGTLLGDAINVYLLGREHSADYYETREEYIRTGDDFMNQNRLEQARRTLLSPVETLMSLTALLGHEIDRGEAASQIGQQAEQKREQMLIDQAQRARPEFDREAQANREKLKADIENLRNQITKLEAELAERRQAYAASGFFSDLWLGFKQDFGYDRHLDKSQYILEGIRWREASLPGLQERLTQMEQAIKQAP
jgi:RHS repeat-associated protein